MILLFEIFRVQALKLRQDEQTVLSYKHIIEVYFAASVFRSLYHDKIPVDGGLIAVESIFVGSSRGKMEASDIFSSKRVSFIGCRIYGFTPRANSPKYREPSSVSRSWFILLSSLDEAFTILPSFISKTIFSNVKPCSSEGVLYDMIPSSIPLRELCIPLRQGCFFHRRILRQGVPLWKT